MIPTTALLDEAIVVAGRYSPGVQRARFSLLGSLAAILAALAIATSASHPAWAQAPADRETTRTPAKKRGRALPLAAAVVPGILVHGSGHFVAGERRAARRLLVMEGVGVGMFLAGGVPLLLTGASRHHAAPSVGLVVTGIGVFGLSWLADLYGAASGGLESPPLVPAPIEIEAGYGYVYDPRFDYRQFAVVGGALRLGATRLAPSAWLAMDDDNQRVRLEAARRLLGAGSARSTGDGSNLEIVAAVTHHRHASDDFAVSTGEAGVAGRLDMARVGDSLAGSFADLSLGLGAELISYDAPGAGADLGEILLVRFGYGVTVGRPGGLHGEASLYYDHRRDTFTGGLSPGNGPGSGFAGLFGADLLLYIGARWGVRARFEQGAARVAHLGLLMRMGETR
jgi:hypothetical protein